MTTLTETAELSPEWLAARVLSLIEEIGRASCRERVL